jgi:uncharacterized membrane protein YagU involved in acid resistance
MDVPTFSSSHPKEGDGMARERSLWKDLFFGAAAGAVGSWLMSPVQSAVSRYIPESAKRREKAVSPSESATVKAGRVALEAVGLHVPDDKKEVLGQAVHFGYGIAIGAAYALIRRHQAHLHHLAGLAFGAALWAISDELLVPALHLSAPPSRYPKETHLRGLASHLAYGASVEEGVWLMRKALA